MKKFEEKSYNAPKFLKKIAVGLAVISSMVAPIAWLTASDVWIRWGFLIFALCCFLGAIESYWIRVRLKDGRLMVRRLFRVVCYERDMIESVSTAKGCPVRLVLTDGRKCDLPDLNESPRKVCNAITTWKNSN